MSGSDGPSSPSLNCGAGKSVHFISMDLNLEMFPVFAVFGPSWFYFIEFVLYCLQGRWCHYLPTISETGIEPFDNTVQSRIFATIGVTSIFSDFLIAFLTFGYESRKSFRWVALLFLVIGMMGTVGIGFADLKNHREWHYFLTFSGFFLLNTFIALTYKMSHMGSSLFDNVSKMLLMTLSWIFLTLSVLAEQIFGRRTCITFSTCGEYGMLTCMEMWLLSYYRELSRSELVLFYSESGLPVP